MPILTLAFPVIDPTIIDIGGFSLRWYAMGYIVSLLLGWVIARELCKKTTLWGDTPHPDPDSLDDLLIFVAIGAVLGGRLGYVLFYNWSYFHAYPMHIPMVWEGGMAFHGGLTGAAIGAWLFARKSGTSFPTVTDLCVTVAPLGLFLVRLANFIKPELWGRHSDVPWAMVFPGAGPLPRHPSQLYEAALEGLVLGLILAIAVRLGAYRRPGLTTGLFAIGYGVARIICEFFREPDPQLGFLFGGATMGMLLSVPLILIGLAFLAYAYWRRPAAHLA